MRKVILKICSFILVIGMIFPLLIFTASASLPAPVINPCDDSYVVNDLIAMGYDPEDYPYDPSANFLQVIHFLEYCYSKTDTRNYSLYLYLYNPSGKEINLTGSKLQLCYTSGGKETSYFKYSLRVASVSLEPGMKNTFYKLEVQGINNIGKTIDGACRVYNLSSVEILYKGDTKPVTKTLSSSDGKNRCRWSYSGFQKGYGSDVGTLQYKVDVLDTIPVEMHAASWMSDTSNLGDAYRWEVKSYYFNIPKSYINKYGNPTISTDDTDGLIAVEGEYYKYGVNGLIVPTRDLYDLYLPSTNRNIGSNSYISSYKTFYDPSVVESSSSFLSTTWYGDLSFNLFPDVIVDVDPLIYYKSKTGLSIYNLLSIGSNGALSSASFSKLWNDSNNPVISNSSQLVMGSKISNLGSRVDFKVNVSDGDLSTSLKTYASNKTWGNLNWLHKWFNKDLYTDEAGYSDCLPLIQINASDINDVQKDEYLASKLYLDYDSYSELKAFYNDNSNGSSVFLMRLGVEPFYEKNVVLAENQSLAMKDFFTGLGRGYYYEKVIYKDTDIFAFTFKNSKSEVQRVPVECDPIDNLGSVPGVGNNPNNYTEDPSAGHILGDISGAIADWITSLKGIVVLVASSTGVIAILVLVVIFWKQLEPIFKKTTNKCGKLLGSAIHGIGGFIGGVVKVIFTIFKIVWNIGFSILFYFTGLDLRIKGSPFDSSTKTEKIERDVDLSDKKETEEKK